MTSAMDDLEQTLTSQSDPARPLLEEIWNARDQDSPADATRFQAADAIGRELLGRGVAPSEGVRLVLKSGRALVESGESRGELDPAQARRLQTLVDEASVQVAAAVERARAGRRQQFLSFLVHEIKNPLNTILNALWLLRKKGSDPKQAGRFLELAERAVRRLEGRTRDVRELDETLRTPPPGWEEKQHQRR